MLNKLAQRISALKHNLTTAELGAILRSYSKHLDDKNEFIQELEQASILLY
jgi:hypothetical protein